MKKVKMLFPRNYNDSSIGKEYEKGKIYEIADNPGSIDRWLRRGCTIVEEKIAPQDMPAKEEDKIVKAQVMPTEEKKEEEIEVGLGKTKKKVTKKVSKNSSER